MNRNPFLAFILAFIPGLGHFYLNRKVRGALYCGVFFGSLFLTFAVASQSSSHDAKLFFLFAVFIWFVNMFDMVVTLVSRTAGTLQTDIPAAQVQGFDQAPANDRFRTILLSFIPGLGHFQLGLMQRGLAFLMAFFGLFIMILFVTFATKMAGFLAFLLALPVIWLYCMFDAVQQQNRKERGETLVDRSIFEELEEQRADGRKSRMIATVLAIFPGAGHMYLGLQRRGLQFMAGFLFSLYILDTLRLSLFLFLIPIIWCYSLFDALQHIAKHGREELADVPPVKWFINHQRWLGYGLLALGAYYLIDHLLIRVLDSYFPDFPISQWYHQYFQTFLVSVILIGGGLWFIGGSKRKNGGTES